MKRGNWNSRVRRADDLVRSGGAASEPLAFYMHILAFQQKIYESVSEVQAELAAGSMDRQPLSVGSVLCWLPKLIELVEENAPKALAQEARRMRSEDRARGVLREFLESEPSNDASGAFFARVLFQPMAEKLFGSKKVLQGSFGANCPACGRKPQLAVLYPEGDGGKRYLACSLCFTHWEFRRVLCPACGETDHTKLPRFSADDLAVRVEACDNCKQYLKSFDMTVNGLMVPEVDEIATIALDVWAGEQGYQKIQPNVLGF